MLADFHYSSTLTWLIEAWNTKVKAGEICLAVSLSNRGETWSGPVVLCGLRWHRSFCTPSRVIVISEKAGCGLGTKSGKGCKGSSSVNTKVNWLFGMFPSFPVVDWLCLFIDLWALTFPLEDYSVFSNFVITLIHSGITIGYPISLQWCNPTRVSPFAFNKAP